jgi:hypothetical protein
MGSLACCSSPGYLGERMRIYAGVRKIAGRDVQITVHVEPQPMGMAGARSEFRT